MVSGRSLSLVSGQWSVVCCPLAANRLLNHFFELLTEHPYVTAAAQASAGRVEAIDGNVKPVSFFAFHDEVLKICGIGCVMTCLRHQVDE